MVKSKVIVVRNQTDFVNKDNQPLNAQPPWLSEGTFPKRPTLMMQNKREKKEKKQVIIHKRQETASLREEKVKESAPQHPRYTEEMGCMGGVRGMEFGVVG